MITESTQPVYILSADSVERIVTLLHSAVMAIEQTLDDNIVELEVDESAPGNDNKDKPVVPLTDDESQFLNAF